jgi:hypothetical protein
VFVHTWYLGASFAKNNCGPIILPAQYIMK